MPRFKYNVRSADGQPQVGEIEAASEAEARQALEARELVVEHLELIVEPEDEVLSIDESRQVTDRLAQLTSSSLPLATGLRAGAEECGNRRISRALLGIAEKVESGQSLEEVVAASPRLFPPHVSGLVLAATKSGTLGAALSELLEHQRSARSLRVGTLRAFAYPLFVTMLAAIVLLFILFAVSTTYLEMFTEFGLELPMSTRLLIWWREYGVAMVGIGLIVSVVLACVFRVTLPRHLWARLVASLPVVGPLSYWMGLAEWCSLLSVLVKNHIALPEALRLSADGIGNAYVARIANDLANRTSAGHSLSELLATERPLPVSLVPLIRWGERLGLLHEALLTARELFDRRAKVRVLLLQSILPPLLFITIAAVVVMVVAALFAPMVGMVTSLS